MNKAILLDLDHTLIQPLEGRIFPLGIDDWEFIDKTIDYIKSLCELDSYGVHIVSNQGGIEAGYITSVDVNKKFNNIFYKLKEKGVPVISMLYCPDMQSYERKPNPGLAYRLACDYQINLKDSIMVGDMATDKEFATFAGIGKYIDVKEL